MLVDGSAAACGTELAPPNSQTAATRRASPKQAIAAYLAVVACARCSPATSYRSMGWANNTHRLCLEKADLPFYLRL